MTSPDSTPRSPRDLSPQEIDDTFAWHASRADIDRVLHHTHWIPRSRGFTERFLQQSWPGWSLEKLIAVFDAAGIRKKPLSWRASAPHGGYCHWNLAYLHFNSRHHLHVEWNDMTFDDGIFHAQRTADSGPRISPWYIAKQFDRPAAPLSPTIVNLGQFDLDDD